jgi:hypothetical protein
VLVARLWITNERCSTAPELNAEIEREKELTEGVPHQETLNRPDLGARG